MGNDTKRTPGKWREYRWKDDCGIERAGIYSLNNKPVWLRDGPNEADMAFIIHACNTHDALVAATTKMLAAWNGYEMLAALDYKVREAVEAALALATEANDATPAD